MKVNGIIYGEQESNPEPITIEMPGSFVLAVRLFLRDGPFLCCDSRLSPELRGDSSSDNGASVLRSGSSVSYRNDASTPQTWTLKTVSLFSLHNRSEV